VLQRHVREINASQECAWRKSIEVFEDGAKAPQTLALFPEDRCEGVAPDGAVVRTHEALDARDRSQPLSAVVKGRLRPTLDPPASASGCPPCASGHPGPRPIDSFPVRHHTPGQPNRPIHKGT